MLEIMKGVLKMEIVQPIRDKTKINAMKRELLKTGTRNYLIFYMGINTGLRIGDILDLRVSDVKGKSHVTIREKKTNKLKRFKITNGLVDELVKQDISSFHFKFVHF